MNKHFLSFSIVILGICVLLGSWLISQSLQSNEVDTTKETQFRYEIISANENNLILFDKQSGMYWQKFIASNAGPTEWEKQISPISRSSK